MIIEKWKQSHTYVIGKDHVKLNQSCQDRTYYAKEDGVHVIALADGAGSRKTSEIGAEVVTKSICELLASEFFNFFIGCEKRGKDELDYLKDNKMLKKIILNTLLNELKKQSEKVDELSSTLLFCALYKNKYIIGHIGDGVIGGIFEEADGLTIRTLSEPKNGGAPNITFFVTDNDAIDHLRITSGEFTNLRGIILMSDGPAEVMYNKNTGLNENVIKIFNNFDKKTPSEYNQILSKFLCEKIANYSSDDLSLNLLYLESLYASVQDTYTLNLLSDISSVDQITYKSKYCVELDPTIKSINKNFSSIDDVRRYLKWI